MQLKIKALKFTKNLYRTSIVIIAVLTNNLMLSQNDSITEVSKNKIDGVAAVIGDFLILDSDIDKQFDQLKASGISTDDMTRCQVFGKLLEDKLYQHHAVQDSIVVNNLEIQSFVDQQIDAFAKQIGSMEKLINYYNKNSEQELRNEMFELNKSSELAKQMQEKIIEETEVTPEEVRQFFNSIPENDRPLFNTELKVAQIVVIPKTTEEEKQKVIDRLEQFKADVVDNGSSFTTKAVLYTEDFQSRKNGGKYTLNRKKPQMVKEYRDVAFSLQEGEISDPFETSYGFFIIILEKIRGQEYDVRSILLKPKINSSEIEEAKEKLENARQRILSGEITFAEAALEVSDQIETKYDGGQLINPETQDYNFELTKIDPELYSQIEKLKDGEVSIVLQDEDRTNPVKFKLLTVTDRTDEHEANFAKDYLKIQSLALQNKKLKEIEKWQNIKIEDTHESPLVMLIPLILLAIGAIFAGFIFKDLFIGHHGLTSNYWSQSIFFLEPLSSEHPPYWIVYLTPLLVIISIPLSYYLFVKNKKITDEVVKGNQPLYKFLLNKWYFDELYEVVFVKSSKKVGIFLWKFFDLRIIDGFGPDGVSKIIKKLSIKANKFQSGHIYQYAFIMLLGFSAFLTLLIIK